MRQLGGDGSEHTAPTPYPQDARASARFDRVGAAVATWLRALPADDEPGELVADLALVLSMTLGGREVLFVASAAMLALDAEDAEALAEDILSDLRAGSPIPPFDSVKAEAELWAGFASPAEVKHYLVAAWNALAEDDRQAFLRRAA